LKKYWSNLKQQNKNILTTERQSRFLTGRGPQQNIDQVDPNVSDIVPDLITTAPTISSSNFSTQESTGIYINYSVIIYVYNVFNLKNGV
jgi:hypothetical protein